MSFRVIIFTLTLTYSKGQLVILNNRFADLAIKLGTCSIQTVDASRCGQCVLDGGGASHRCCDAVPADSEHRRGGASVDSIQTRHCCAPWRQCPLDRWSVCETIKHNGCRDLSHYFRELLKIDSCRAALAAGLLRDVETTVRGGLCASLVADMINVR